MGARTRGGAFRRLAVVACALVGAAGFASTATAEAATYTVGPRSDTTPGQTCLNFPSGCSLRQLIEHENGLSSTGNPPDIIVVPAGAYSLTNGPLAIDQSVAIFGVGARGTSISQNTTSPTSRVFDIEQNVNLGVTPTVVISGLELRGGTADSSNGYFGGDIRNQANLELTEDLITGGNAASGGGISNDGGSLFVANSLVYNNVGGSDSGGIQNYGNSTAGQLVVEDSTVAGNTSAEGGGIFSWCDGTDGACSSDGTQNTTTVINSTIADNDGGSRNSSGGGLLVSQGAIYVENSIVAGNTVSGGGADSNCGASSPGVITSLGHNLDSGNDCGFTAAGDLQSTDPLFTSPSPQDNGGNTDTLALSVTSPAVDSLPSDASGCGGIDQRDITRPQGTGCDIGAYEVLQPPAGHSFTEVVGDIVPPASVTSIDWGDGTTSAPDNVDSTTGAVTGTHAYARPGVYHGSIDWVDSDHLPEQTPFDVKVVASSSSASAGASASAIPITGMAGKAFSGAVATVTDSDPSATASDFTATIDWGDGTASPGRVSAHPGGGFDVSGTHTYTRAGTFTTTVSIADSAGATAVTHGIATIDSAPAAVLTGAPSVGHAHAAFRGSVDPGGLPTSAHFEYGLDSRYSKPGTSGPIYDHSTPAKAVGSDFSAHTVSASVNGLVPNALYHVRLVATNSAGRTVGPDQTFRTPKSAPPPAPTVGHTFNITPVHGTVLIKIHGVYVPLTQVRQIPQNTPIDALHGTLRLVTVAPGGAARPAHDAAAKHKRHKGKGKRHKPKTKTQSGTFGGAIFTIGQVRGGRNRGLVTLSLVENAFKGAPSYATCKRHPGRDATTARVLGLRRGNSRRVVQLLHSSAHGKFRTKGRYSAATVRGTKWTIADRCDGTLTHDISHSVAVTDFVRHRTIILHAGQSYLAKARRH